jgi:hypothetical protein
MAGVKCENKPVKETPAASGGIEENPVHLGRKPDAGDVILKDALAACRLAIHPHKTFLTGLRRACPKRNRPTRRFNKCGNSPWLARHIAVLHIRRFGRAQPAPGGEHGNGFQYIRFPRAIRPGQNHRPARQIAQAVLPVTSKMRQRKAR